MNAREDWLAARRKGIGGSDAAAALGQSRYKSSYELWAEKTGALADEKPDTERMLFGRVMESVIANLYAERHGVHVRRRNAIIHHPKYHFMLANVDRVIEGVRVGLECKNVDSLAYRFGEWGEPGSDQVPTEYLLQCAHYMFVLDYPEWHLAACIGGNHLATYVIHRDRELDEMVVDGESAFWNRVESGQPPGFDFEQRNAVELLRRLHPGTSGGTIALDADVDHWHAVRLEADQQVGMYQAVSDGARAHILHAMGNAAVGTLPHGGEYKRKTVHRRAYTVDETDYVTLTYSKPKEAREVSP